MYPHRIRLRGPWECEPLARQDSSEPLPPPVRMTMPTRWAAGGLPQFTGLVRFRRRFGYPGRIDAHERVYLTCAGLSDRAEFILNGTCLATDQEGGAEFEVTALLRERNELLVEVQGKAEDGGLWGEVALEIRCLAYLREVRVWLAQDQGSSILHAAGTVVGSAERPLDLYVLRDRRTVAYTTVEPTVSGQDFHLTAEVEGTDRAEISSLPVQVDLVNGASVWYTWQGNITHP